MVTDAVRAVNGIHPVLHNDWKAPTWLHVVREKKKHKIRQHPGPIICVQKFGLTCQKSAQNKSRWAVGKPKLDNARKLRGIYFVDRDDMEFKAP